MSGYQVLAREWRPRSFDEVVGQQVVVETLRRMLDSGNLHHAYLFTGTRGVGKTTLARLLAKALCCCHGVSSKPCGECRHCIAIDQGIYPDLLEIDAASNTRVEDMRELLSQIQFLPLEGSYKIYLIDEVHMLSTHSFNALLKTLEEPPEHVKFLFATTDPQKIPVTVLSRVLQFDLRALSDQQIGQQLCKILDTKRLVYQPVAVSLISRAGNGSMRDALTVLEQALAYAGPDGLTVDNLSKLLGVVGSEQLFAILRGLLQNDGGKVCEVLDQIADFAVDYTDLLDELLLALQQLAMVQLIDGYRPRMRESYRIEVLHEMSKLATPEQVQLCYQILLNGKRDLIWAADQLSGLEMLLLRCLAFTTDDLRKRVDHINYVIGNCSSSEVKSGAVASEKTIKVKKNRDSLIEDDKDNESGDSKQETANFNSDDEIVGVVNHSETCDALLDTDITKISQDKWTDILAKLPCTGLTRTLLQYCVFVGYKNGVVTLSVDPSQQAIVSSVHSKRIAAAISLAIGTEVTVQIDVGDNNMDTPIAKADKVKQEKLATAYHELKNDNTILALQKELAADLSMERTCLVE